MLWFCPVCWPQDMTICLASSAITAIPISSLAATKASVFLFTVCVLPPNILTSQAKITSCRLPYHFISQFVAIRSKYCKYSNYRSVSGEKHNNWISTFWAVDSLIQGVFAMAVYSVCSTRMASVTTAVTKPATAGFNVVSNGNTDEGNFQKT